ncbi:hypothetical protein CRI94_05500 [Longibacter salinarum]|uniref:DUF5689 domain-containing protein n=1 Tax=Longibacter salinarum TaxID=1850348 RepID=A0A2A8D0S0_9BACT|nr:DUF5689 domain-containing protein [Longibacter salinarum]PEN14481.1 hypothetical protein CRI94_05500 [Longibacter salinarum]
MLRFLSIPFALLLFAAVLAGCDSNSGIPSDVGDDSTIAFAKESDTAPEDTSTYSVDVVVNDPGYKELTVDVVLSQASTIDPSEIELPENTTLSFPKSTTGGESKTFTFEVVDDDTFLEGDETIILELQNATGASTDEVLSTFTLTVTEDDVTLTTMEAKALPEGERAIVDGIVTRVESDGFYLQDDTGALFVFDSSISSEVTQGDEVRVDGSTTYFSGLFQIESVGTDGLTALSSGNSLPDVQVVTLGELESNGEEYESELIRVEGFDIDDGGDATFAGGSNYPVSNTSGSLTLRIPGGSELEGDPIPATANFQGVLGQFNNFGEPDDNTGYQLLGLLDSDVQDASAPAITIAEARAASDGTNVIVEGIITRYDGENVFFQDDTAGIVAFEFDGNIASGTAIGDELRVEGEVGEFNGLRQVGPTITSFEVLSSNNTLPTPVDATINEITSDGEAYEGELVRVTGLSVDATGTFSGGTTYTATDASGSMAFRIQGDSFYAGESVPGQPFTFQGVVGEYQGAYQLLPLRDGDLQ